ncbi:DNA adenine methylase [Terasakiella pusilla]|uniref:DNA adenine methylase n=1 Tax=Terasakiella pusilla TaxID=64973 RepID=UPI003AA8D7AD
MKFSTPLRYPGGKGRLSRYIGEIIELNGLSNGCYVEPYAGGAGIAISLLQAEFVQTVHLNDISKPVYSFWHSVLRDTENLCRLINDTPVTIDEWFARREKFRNFEELSLLELGFTTFFLNRTNRSGILHAGVIGGKEQTGKWKLDARFNKNDLVARIQKLAQYSGRISLSQLDTVDLIKEVLPTISKRSLVYFDPPYYVKGQGLYQNHYNHDDHEEIADLVQNRVQQHWVVSYDNVPEICDMYSKCRQEVFSLSYSAQQHYKGSEVMVFKDDLFIPENVYASRGAVA